MKRRKGQAALFAVALLSLAVLTYIYAVASTRVSIVYRGEAEWMLLLATARHSLAANTSLATLMDRLKAEATRQGVWLPPVQWIVYRSTNNSGWTYTALFYNSTLGWEAGFKASASYRLLGAEYDALGNLWLLYNLSYIHVYRLPEYGYPILLRPEPLNSSCARAYKAGTFWLVKLRPPCTLRDKWGIVILGVP